METKAIPDAGAGRRAGAPDAAGAADGSPSGDGRQLTTGSHAYLWEIAHLLASEDSLERVLDAVAAALGTLVPYDTLTVYRADLALGVLRPVLCRDTYAEEIMAMDPLPLGHGITGSTAETGTPQLVNDAHLDPRAQQIPGTPVEAESMVVVPLVARGECQGALSLYRLGEGNHFLDDEFRLAIRFSDLAAIAIDNATTRVRLESQVVTDPLTGLRNHAYFQERLREEIQRATRQRTTVGVALLDTDDFKRVNDCFGHPLGDQVLQGIASILRETCRTEDVLCRIGGDEFAAILPGSDADGTTRLAERLRRGIAATEFPVVGGITVSVGVAEAPLHSTSRRDLIARADLALRQAKADGKDRVHVFDLADEEGPLPIRTPGRGEVRSVAHLKMLQSLAAKLNRLNDVHQIGETILVELRGLIDYHNCRIHLLSDDGDTLVPIAFKGHLLEYQGETFDALLTMVGEGITGRVAATGKPLNVPNAQDFEGAVQIPGTPDVEESILAVPLRYVDRVTGTIVLSKLGVDQFDQDDMRLLEVLASNAAVALENARLLQVERESAATSRTLLEFSRVLTQARNTADVLREAMEAIPSMLGCPHASAWIRDAGSGVFREVSSSGFPPDDAARLASIAVPPEVAEPFLLSLDHPFVLTRETVARVPSEYRLGPEWVTEVLVAPIRWDPDGLGAILVHAAEDGFTFSDRHLRLAGGLADIASLALNKASRFEELERAYLSTVEALANALEAQDEYTHSHARSLAEMALAVGTDLGFEGQRLKMLELAALFHDIGKIGVPSEIIRKPGPLTAHERRIINRHPAIGEEILEPVPFLRPIRSIIRACHERYDGHGYPDGIGGEDIPLEARIVFVCDAFHAMTTDRPYRDALPEKEAMRRLKLSAGTQFDPGVVGAFVRLHAEGRIPAPHPYPRAS